MRSEFLPFSRPSITEDDVTAVTEVLRSGWLTSGPQAAAFEKAFAEYLGCPGAVSLSSATAGMQVLLRALNIGPGDEVITPSLTWVSTVNVIALADATPVFVDVDRETLISTIEDIRQAITPRTKLILPVHFAGSAADSDALIRLSEETGISVVEDAAQALGTHYQGRPVGQRGSTLFSFHPLKSITTGEGGMFCSDDPELLDRVRHLKYNGLGKNVMDDKTQGRAPHVEVLEPGFSYNLPDMAAALGLRQLARLEMHIRKRTQLAQHYRQGLADIEEILPIADTPCCTRHGWQLFVVRLDIDRAGMTRSAFMDAMKARNIGMGLHFRPIHLHKYYAENMDSWPGKLPHTEWNAERVCSLPLFTDMILDDVDHVIEAIKDVLA
ncbi:aminotransferase class I/II-fold pyridoxal phosphate-dependent enzyme [Planctomycetota bacterium]